MSVHRRRLGLYVPWAAFAALTLGWFGYWFWLKDASIHRIEAYAAEVRAQGGVAEIAGPIGARGFPLHLTLALPAVRLAPSAKLAVEAPGVDLSVDMSNPQLLLFDLRRGFTVRADARTVHVAPRKAALSVRADAGGALARASLVIEDADVAVDGGAHAFTRLAAHVRPDPRNDADLQLESEAESKTEKLSAVRAAVVLEGARTKAPESWFQAAMRVEALRLEAGEARADGSGRLKLGAEGEPEGALAVTTDTPAAFASIFAPRAVALLPASGKMKLALTAKRGAWAVEAPTPR